MNAEKVSLPRQVAALWVSQNVSSFSGQAVLVGQHFGLRCTL